MNRLASCFVSFVKSSTPSVLTAFAVTASFAATLGASAPAHAAGDICIGDSAKQALAACPNNGPSTFQQHGKAPALNFHTAPQPADLKKRDQQTRPNQPSEQMTAGQRDDRKSRLQQRAQGLLIGELQGLENLLSNTPGNSPDRLQLVRRLAEDYVELENVGFTQKTQAEVKRDELKKSDPAGAGRQQAVANQMNNIMLKARQKAEQFYTTITTDFPNYPQLDEVLYYLAYEYEQGNNADLARKTYYQLITTRPNSKYIPNAYLAFGELFFNEAQGDPSKWPVAQQAYQKVIGFPPPDNKVYGYAWYKLAYVQWNSGDFPGALSAFKKTIDYGTTFTTMVQAGNSIMNTLNQVFSIMRPTGALNKKLFQWQVAFTSRQSVVTTLNGSINVSTTSVTLTSGTNFVNGDIILIDQEQMTITAGGGTTGITVTRGTNGTIPTVHTSGVNVTDLSVAPQLTAVGMRKIIKALDA